MEYTDVIGADLQKTTAQVSKLWPTGQIHPPPFSANQVVLEHSHDRLLCIVYSSFTLELRSQVVATKTV